jgi:hypothetical protein
MKGQSRRGTDCVDSGELGAGFWIDGAAEHISPELGQRAASPQSMLRPSTVALMVMGPFGWGSSDRGAATVGGDHGAGDIAGAG